jgi:hypothetical protein
VTTPDTWTDGELWGGKGAANKDPYFAIDVNFRPGQ